MPAIVNLGNGRRSAELKLYSARWHLISEIDELEVRSTLGQLCHRSHQRRRTLPPAQKPHPPLVMVPDLGRISPSPSPETVQPGDDYQLVLLR